MKNIIIFLTGILIFSLGVFAPSQAQVEKVEIRVDGLACPFCAYGLEKKLKELEGVDKVQINVDKGLAVLENKQDKSIAVDMLESVVQDAGFTPGEMQATVVGKLNQTNDTPVFQVVQSNVEFILKQNEALQNLQSELNGSDKSVRIHGSLTKETPEGHHAHPFTLAIEKFEVTQ